MIARDFSDTLRYHETAEPATLLADIAELGKRSKSARFMRSVWIILLVISVVTGLIAGAAIDIFLGLFVILPGAMIFGFLIYYSSKQILDERRRKLAVWVVWALACDVPPGGTLEVGIDFNPYTRKTYLHKTGQQGSYKATLYRLAWLMVVGKLADGTRLEFGADFVVNRKERAKTKGRKKIKEDIHEQIHLRVQAPTLPPNAQARWPELVRRTTLPGGAYLHAARVKKDRLLLDVRTQRQIRITNKGTIQAGKDLDNRLATRHTLLAPLLCAYEALHDCRKGA